MNFSKPNANAKAPVIRKSTVRVPISQATDRIHSATPQPARRPDPNRFKLSSRDGANLAKPQKQPTYAERALSTSRGTKRKSVTPQRAVFSDDEDDSSDVGASDSDVSRKRMKSSVSSVESTGPRRDLIAEEAFGEHIQKLEIIHGRDLTSGKLDKAQFKNAWLEDGFECVNLRYPYQGQRERFELKEPKHGDNEYKPMEDIMETIYTMIEFYFPEELHSRYLKDEDNGFRRRFAKAQNRRDIYEFIDIVKDFNAILQGLITDGRIKQVLMDSSTLDLMWVRRILDQVYARTVSPQVRLLHAYENGTDNVYGELLPSFVSKIFKKTKLTCNQIFVDLGSGVGNVVLQAALEIGCESHGIEMMKNPCDLADLQAKEFRTRTKLWGLSAGEVHLYHGDFTVDPDNKKIGEVLKRADVVLVNNQAFTPSLNDKLRDMFLDLKEGCIVVSLKPFVPEGHRITNRNVDSVVNLFVQQKDRYFSNSVSWTDAHGDYFIATKDSRPLDAFVRKSKS